MDNLIKKQNININPSTTVKTNEGKTVAKESAGNFFETLASSSAKFSWKSDVETEISKIKRQTNELENILNAGPKGSNLNIVG